ncbi:Type IV secretion-system coupling protein DNA-binding domain-containing protein [Arenibacter nanhaiticus]|uniref:Type IV secretion-system coupling protein DNA-binding domain-containing protein n=1 Tax=Arenibacter nanhaiticus TaxID=558155 RepID=A0A1M6KVY1_9FLAO|nr:type IV secretion system DNA-binding domain-containing protein [Arenibacter nanhaiticus]SHJ63004.1 Type IV secretion-system coupling protein DNA-binding domain-containing protein [Arenibacter nanhaiticus]
MMTISILIPVSIYGFAIALEYLSFKCYEQPFAVNLLIISLLGIVLQSMHGWQVFASMMLVWLLPFQVINLGLFIYFNYDLKAPKASKTYRVKFSLLNGSLVLKNIRRGASIIGSAGSGKTESVVYNFLKHFSQQQFSGVIHDYKNFEITEMAYPLFIDSKIPFHIISFDDIHCRVNPIAPRYMEDEESVNEVSRVLLENLLEQRESIAMGSSKFFNDAVEGLLGGLIWKLKTSHEEYCTLPHLIATFQYLDTDNLIEFLSSDYTSKAMANAFISGKDSERQTAGVMSTLANALKKISTQRIFMTLSADEVPLDLNNPEHPSVVSIINNPKFETAYSPVIATLIHTITKQLSTRGRRPSFVLMEEAPTIRLLNMHRIPATLRSYDIATIYVLQDKIQNDMMYGDKASRAILSNLSYQFFGKANDPDTARYYERFFEIVKRPTKSVSTGENTLGFDTRITKGEREVSKIRAEEFFKLKEGEFIAFADGKDKKVRFPKPSIAKALPMPKFQHGDGAIKENFDRIHLEVRQFLRLQNK